MIYRNIWMIVAALVALFAVALFFAVRSTLGQQRSRWRKRHRLIR